MVELNNGEEFTKEELAVFDQKYLEAFKNLAALSKHRKTIDDQEKTIKESLEKAMDDYGIKSIDNEYIKITRIAENPGKTTVDVKKLEKEEPELYKELLEDYPVITGKKKSYVMFKVK